MCLRSFTPAGVMSRRLPGKEADSRRVIWDSGVMNGRRRSGSERAEHHGQRGAAATGRGGHLVVPENAQQVSASLGPSVFERDGGELASPGLFVNLGPWQFHLIALQ